MNDFEDNCKLSEEEEGLITNEGIERPLKRISSDKIGIEMEMAQTTLLLNTFATKIFSALPRPDKNHIICPVDLYASFGIEN